MTKITTLDLNPFYRNAIGIDKLFDRLITQVDTANSQNYPPYNILTTGENEFEVQVAVAGFTQGEIEVSVSEGNLIITGEKLPVELPVGTEYTHKGISDRRFIRSFSLADHVEVTTASVKNGILTVKLIRLIPEALLPKSIAITYES